MVAEGEAALKELGGRDKPGNRKLSSYNLPDWVRHPQKTPKLKAALLFPGEQNHAVGMLQEVRRRPAIRAMLESATRTFGFDVEELMLEGPAAEMAAPGVSAALVYVADCAAFEVLREATPELAERCQAVAGFGVGEYAALYAAGVLTFEQGLSVVKARGDALQELAEELQVEALSIRGMEVDTVERLIKAVKRSSGGEEIHIARRWCPDGVVCTGGPGPVATLQDLIRREEGENRIELRSLGNLAGNTPLAKTACAKVAAALSTLAPKMKPSRCDVYLNQTGRRVPAGRSPLDFVEALKSQLAGPILWESCVTQMLTWGIREFWECGPNRSLKFMMGYFEHLVEAPLEIVRPAELTQNVSV